MRFRVEVFDCPEQSPAAFRPLAIDVLMKAVESLRYHYFWSLEHPNDLLIDTKNEFALSDEE